jgi:small subunit ribosomal protein S18
MAVRAVAGSVPAPEASSDPRPGDHTMSQFQSTPQIPHKASVTGRKFVDYKNVDDLRRLLTPNGKIYSRRRLQASAWEQRQVATAIKRARFMALLPYTSATL